MFSRYSYPRVIASKVFHSLQGHAKSNPFFSLMNFFSRENTELFLKHSNNQIFCTVCGDSAGMLYDFPNIQNRKEHRIGLLRETLQCRNCGATMRNRTLALELLNVLNPKISSKARSIKELSVQSDLPLRILETDSFSSISKLLKHDSNLVRSSYTPGLPFGTEIEVNRFNINLEKIDFPDNSFDVVLTSDVAEHIRDIDSAHSEIYRVLRSGGTYIFTVPFDPDCTGHHILVDTTQAEDIFLVPKQLHGDPLTGGILAYRVFGQKTFSDLKSIGFTVEFLSTVRPDLGIYGGDVFIATK